MSENDIPPPLTEPATGRTPEPTETSPSQTPGTSAAAAAGLREAPTPTGNIRSLAARSKEARVAKLRSDLRKILVQDYAETMAQEEAEDEADDKLDDFFNKKELHGKVLQRVRFLEKGAKSRLLQATQHLDNLQPLLDSLGQVDPEEFPVPDVRRAKLLLESAKSILTHWGPLEIELEDLAKEAQELFYRPKLEDEPASAIVAQIRDHFLLVWATYSVADGEMEALFSPPMPPPPPPAAVIPPASTVKKPYARDFKIDNYVKTFSGDESPALDKFATWRSAWDHGRGKVEEDCQEVNDAALLHLLRSTLSGTAERISESALSVEAALAILENRYDDVVGLVESYLPLPAAMKEPVSAVEETAQAMAFAERWPRIRNQLQAHNVDLDCFTGVRIQLASFGGAAAKKWKAYTKAKLRALPESTKLGDVYNWPEFKKWLQELQDEAEVKAGEEDDSSPGMFAVSATGTGTANNGTSTPLKGCLACGTSATHGSAVCHKIANMDSKAFFELCQEKDICKRCVLVPWSRQHLKVCSVKCETCGKPHLSSRHKFAITVKAKKRAQDPPNRRERKKMRVDPSREPSRSESTSSLEDRLEAVERVVEARDNRRDPPQYAPQRGGGRNRGHRGRGGRGGKASNFKKEVKKE